MIKISGVIMTNETCTGLYPHTYNSVNCAACEQQLIYSNDAENHAAQCAWRYKQDRDSWLDTLLKRIKKWLKKQQ